MKVATHITLYRPTPPKGEVGIQEIIAEDVSSFEFTENGITLHFNTSPDQVVPLRGNDGKDETDWRGVSLYVTRKFLEIDTSK